MGVLNDYANAAAVNAALNKGVEASKAVSELKEDLTYFTDIAVIPITESGYIVTSGATVDITDVVSGATWMHTVVDCSENDTFTITGTGGSVPRVWCFIDSSGNVLSKASQTPYIDYEITAPHGASKLVVNVLKTNNYRLLRGALVKNLRSQFMELSDSHKTIYPTGDTTNRAFEIAETLSKYKSVYFSEGEYYISSAITMPDNTKIYGAGKSSVLIFGDSATGTMINCGNDCQINNLRFEGGLIEKPTSLTNRHCIRVKDNKQTLQIDNCFINGFGGSGIIVDATGYAQLSSIQMSNCYFSRNFYAIHFMEHGEYGAVSNCSFIDNCYGAYVQGGNNIFTGCCFERNTIGARANGENVDNHGHGAFVGCSFNHNAEYGIQVSYVTTGYLISGCQFFRNGTAELAVTGSGINITGCQFGVSSKLRFLKNDTLASVSNCMFGSKPTLMYTESARTKSSNNFSFDGTKIDILHPNDSGDSEGSHDLKMYNAFNVINPVTVSSTTINGLTYSANKGVFDFESGVADKFTAINIGNVIDTYPDFLNVGDKVYLYLAESAISGIKLQVLYQGGNVIFETTTHGWFILPELTSPLRIRFSVISNTTFNGERVVPYLGKSLPDSAISNMLFPNEFPPMLTIIDDDAHEKFYTDVLPIIIDKKIPISTSVPISDIGTANHMTWEQIAECYDNGAEVLSHTYNHMTTYPDGYTKQDVYANYAKSKNILTRKGFLSGQHLVYSGTTGESPLSKQVAPLVHDIAINSSGNRINQRQTIDWYNIRRYRIQTDSYNYDVDALKALVDECLATGGWMVWMFHTSDSATWTEQNKANLISVIQYAIDSGLPIVTVDHVVNTYKHELN